MNWIELPYLHPKLARAGLRLTGGIALVCFSFTSHLPQLSAQPTEPVSNVRFIPPPLPPVAERGAPLGRQQGGASRGQCPAATQPLTALVPTPQQSAGTRGNSQSASDLQSVWGLTVAEHPTLWFYVPYPLTPQLPVEFVLQDAAGNNVYKKELATETPPGIIKFSLPATVAPLAVGKRYHWYFSIYCDPDDPTFVEGWVQREAIAPTLAKKLEKATPRERLAIYAENGIWYDALTTVAELQSNKPQNAALNQDWVSLLSSVGLEAIAREPLRQCCTAAEKR